MKKSKNSPGVTKYARPSWDDYFSQLVRMVGSRGTCERGRSGCVIAKDKRILTTGYVGSPIGQPHCDDEGHEFQDVVSDDGKQSKHCIRTLHAEQNALVQAARIGVSVEGATLYCQMTPCYVCAKMIVNSGIKRVVSNNDYHASEKSKKLFKDAKIQFVLLNKEIQPYENQK